VQCWLFDLDGVLTPTALIHAAAWKATFDPVLAEHGQAPFDASADYLAYVDGKAREDGVRGLLASRHIDATPELVTRIATEKDAAFGVTLKRDGIKPYPDALAFLHALTPPCAVVSSSRNCQEVVRVAGLTDLLDARVDGTTAATEHLAGKPAPDLFLAGARALGFDASVCAVVEDALVGVQAGHAGHFGLTVGVDRQGGDHRARLLESGADIVVSTLTELSL
jgi:HAD superfamily hydrolase (TIGR01509 family)